MPTWGERTDVVRIVEGLRGRVSCAWSWCCVSAMATSIPWVHRVDGALLATGGPHSARGARRRRNSRRRFPTVARVHGRERTAHAVRDHFFPVARAATAAHRSVRGARSRPQRWWDKWCGAMRLRGPMARCRDALADHAQEPDLRADRRHRRGADHVAARTDRRHAQLGLSLLLGARFHVHAVCAAARGIPRGSCRVARLAAALGRGPARGSANAVRRRRRPRPHRVRGAVAAGYETRSRCASATPPRCSCSSTSMAS